MIYERIINLHLLCLTPVDPPTVMRVMNQVKVMTSTFSVAKTTYVSDDATLKTGRTTKSIHYNN